MLTDFIRLEEWDHSIPEKRGRYTARDAHNSTWKQTMTECPYCHGPMQALERDSVCEVNRVADVGEIYANGTRQRATLLRIPAHVILYRCRPCRQNFTSLESPDAD